MPCLIARTVPLLLTVGSSTPEVLRDALLHDTANLTAGGIVFDTDGQVAKSLSVQKSKSLLGDSVALVLDESLL